MFHALPRLLSAKSGHWLTVNSTSKPTHLGASRAYVENVTAAEFCEQGGRGLVPANFCPEFGSQCFKFRLVENRIVKRVGHHFYFLTAHGRRILDHLC